MRDESIFRMLRIQRADHMSQVSCCLQGPVCMYLCRITTSTSCYCHCCFSSLLLLFMSLSLSLYCCCCRRRIKEGLLVQEKEGGQCLAKSFLRIR